MEYQHIKRIWKSPFYVKWKKHSCPVCGAELTVIKASAIADSKSKAAEAFDFSSGDSYMIGKVKFIWDEFQCPSCHKAFSIDEVKKAEKEKAPISE